MFFAMDPILDVQVDGVCLGAVPAFDGAITTKNKIGRIVGRLEMG